MQNSNLDRPKVITIKSRDWWVNVLGMLWHDWALIETTGVNEVTVYFFHDGGGIMSGLHQPKPPKDQFFGGPGRGQIAMVDSLTFPSMEIAEKALRRNHFELIRLYPGPWEGCEPDGEILDYRPYQLPVYSQDAF